MVQSSPRGRATSWFGVLLMFLTFLLGCVALIMANWPLFWVGLGLFIAAGILSLAVGIMRDVH